MANNPTGFTLIELLIVIAIIAVLATIGLVTYSNAQKSARIAVRVNDLSEQLPIALELYKNSNKYYPKHTTVDCITNNLTELVPNFINRLPKDPLQKDDGTNCYKYQSDAEGAEYKIWSTVDSSEMSNNDYKQKPDLIDPSRDGTGWAVYMGSNAPAWVLPGAPTTTQPPPPTTTPATYKRVFLTSTEYGGDLKTAGSSVGLGVAVDGLDGADKICQARANATSLGGTWKAWLSSTTVSASSRLSHSTTPYKSIDGVDLVANNWTDLTDGTHITYIRRSEFVWFATGVYPWTNTRIDGSINSTNTAHTCSDWRTSGVYNGIDIIGIMVGISYMTDSSWTQAGPWAGYGCADPHPLYCFEQ